VDGKAAELNRLPPMKAIRAKCMDCSCGSHKEVSLCPCTDCALYPYRFGHNPARLGLGKGRSVPRNKMARTTPGNQKTG
jgi:hypothetical protein